MVTEISVFPLTILIMDIPGMLDIQSAEYPEVAFGVVYCKDTSYTKT
jgi:hypothetical protein